MNQNANDPTDIKDLKIRSLGKERNTLFVRYVQNYK